MATFFFCSGRPVSRVLYGKAVTAICLEQALLPVSSHPQRSVGQTPAKSRSAYGVASDRVYICTQLPVVPVSSYLAFPSLPPVGGGLFLLHFPGGFPRRTLSVILPCDARTFLTLIPFGATRRGSPVSRINSLLQKLRFVKLFVSLGKGKAVAVDFAYA